MCLRFYFGLFNFKTSFQGKKFLHNYIYAMDKAYFRHMEGAEEFHLSFHYKNSEFNIDRKFNFCRQITENVNSFLKRISTNVEKVFQKKNKKRRTADGEKSENFNIDVQLCINNEEINGEISCESIFKNNDDIVLTVLGKKYKIIKNSPWINSISLPSSIMANYPVYPVKFEAVFTNKGLSEFVWHKSNNKNQWEQIGTGFIFVPSNQEINTYLKLTCFPRSENLEGPLTEVVSDVVVQASPGYCPFETRHQFTKQKKTGNEFRVVTYNILADLYCDSDFSRTALYPYCLPYALNIDYRKLLIVKELIGYNADIICLQEVDRKIFLNDLQPVFSSLGYDSDFCLKGGQVVEGLTCFFNKERFSLLETNSLVFAENLENNEIFKQIWEAVSKNEKLKERILGRTTAIQTVALQSKEHDEIALVANTHLFFHPDADHIRLLQGALAIKYIESVKNDLQKKTKCRVSIIFCGDFNSVPECGIYQLYTTGSVSSECVDWKSNTEEAVEGLSLCQPFNLASACGTPQYTNYTAGFGGCLDYIYYEVNNLEVTHIVPLPSTEELTQHTALPSVVFPSDHISLVSDLKWR